MRIAGFIFLLIGAIVAIASFFLQRAGHKMALFIYVGIAMAVFGLLRMYIDKSESKESEAERRAKLAAMLPQGQRHAAEIPRVCGNCGTRNNPRANFCGQCGDRLRG